MSAKINIFFISFLVIFLVNTPIAKAQDVTAMPPDLGNSQVLKANGAAFKEGWNFFTLGFDGCTVKNVLDELQANGGSALNVANLFVKENSWQPYSFLSSNAKDKKIGSDQLLAFNSNQNFFLGITKNNCLNPDSQRQAQIEQLTEGGATKQSVMSKIGELPFDLWTKLTNLVNSAPSSQNTSSNSNKQNNFDTLTVTGKATFNDLGITGKVSAGVLAINGFSADSNTATINTLSGDLYFQNNSLGGVNFLSGKLLIDKSGNLTVLNTITAQKVEADQFATTKAAGSAVLLANTASVDVISQNATGNMRILITPTTLTDKVMAVTNKTLGKFTVSVKQTDPQDIKFDWFIVN